MYFICIILIVNTTISITYYNYIIYISYPVIYTVNIAFILTQFNLYLLNYFHYTNTMFVLCPHDLSTRIFSYISAAGRRIFLFLARAVSTLMYLNERILHFSAVSPGKCKTLSRGAEARRCYARLRRSPCKR